MEWDRDFERECEKNIEKYELAIVSVHTLHQDILQNEPASINGCVKVTG